MKLQNLWTVTFKGYIMMIESAIKALLHIFLSLLLKSAEYAINPTITKKSNPLSLNTELSFNEMQNPEDVPKRMEENKKNKY